MSKMKELKDLYLDELQDLYSAESQLMEALPKVATKASNKTLKSAFEAHLQETKTHQQKVADLLKSHDEKPGKETCDAMKGLIKETEKMMGEEMTPEVMDAALIACAQRVEHYEMSGYGTVRSYAESLGLDKDVKVITSIFDQEAAADKKLSSIAEGTVNEKALAGASSK